MLLLLIFVVGCGLRFAWPDRLAIEHFDEGVYASNIWFGPDDAFRYPAQHLYAPPLLPTLIEWIFTLAGPSNFGAMLPSLVAGSLMIPLVWWVGRSWIGPMAGLASATLCALSDPHVVFSRSALTDVLLCFWVLLAVHLIWRSLTRGGVWSAIGAGACTGLAWWTKYNGWLPLAIGWSALVPWLIWKRMCTGDEATLRKFLLPAVRLIAITLVAIAAWAPWVWSLQSRGGYSAVAANHRKYVVGIAGWWNSAIDQGAKLRELSGSPAAHAVLVGLLIAVLSIRWTISRFTWNDLGRGLSAHPMTALVLVVLVAGGPMLFGPCLFYLGASLLGLVLLHIDLWRSREAGPTSLAAWLLTAWFMGMTVSTPAYTPYPRLLLPWQVATWLAVGLLLQRILSRFVSDPVTPAIEPEPARPSPWRLTALVISLAGLLLSAEWMAFPREIPGWRDRSWVRRVATWVKREAEDRSASDSRSGGPFVIYTISEPALLFQLRLLGVEHVRPLSSLRLAREDAPRPVIPTFVLIGEQAMSTPGLPEELNSAWKRLGEIWYGPKYPSPIVRLDDADWKEPPDWETSRVTLYELH